MDEETEALSHKGHAEGLRQSAFELLNSWPSQESWEMVELTELVKFKVGHCAGGNTWKGTQALGQDRTLAGEGSLTRHTWEDTNLLCSPPTQVGSDSLRKVAWPSAKQPVLGIPKWVNSHRGCLLASDSEGVAGETMQRKALARIFRRSSRCGHRCKSSPIWSGPAGMCHAHPQSWYSRAWRGNWTTAVYWLGLWNSSAPPGVQPSAVTDRRLRFPPPTSVRVIRGAGSPQSASLHGAKL